MDDASTATSNSSVLNRVDLLPPQSLKRPLSPCGVDRPGRKRTPSEQESIESEDETCLPNDEPPQKRRSYSLVVRPAPGLIAPPSSTTLSSTRMLQTSGPPSSQEIPFLEVFQQIDAEVEMKRRKGQGPGEPPKVIQTSGPAPSEEIPFLAFFQQIDEEMEMERRKSRGQGELQDTVTPSVLSPSPSSSSQIFTPRPSSNPQPTSQSPQNNGQAVLYAPSRGRPRRSPPDNPQAPIKKEPTSVPINHEHVPKQTESESAQRKECAHTCVSTPRPRSCTTLLTYTRTGAWQGHMANFLSLHPRCEPTCPGFCHVKEAWEAQKMLISPLLVLDPHAKLREGENVVECARFARIPRAHAAVAERVKKRFLTGVENKVLPLYAGYVEVISSVIFVWEWLLLALELEDSCFMHFRFVSWDNFLRTIDANQEMPALITEALNRGLGKVDFIIFPSLNCDMSDCLLTPSAPPVSGDVQNRDSSVAEWRRLSYNLSRLAFYVPIFPSPTESIHEGEKLHTCRLLDHVHSITRGQTKGLRPRSQALNPYDTINDKWIYKRECSSGFQQSVLTCERLTALLRDEIDLAPPFTWSKARDHLPLVRSSAWFKQEVVPGLKFGYYALSLVQSFEGKTRWKVARCVVVQEVKVGDSVMLVAHPAVAIPSIQTLREIRIEDWNNHVLNTKDDGSRALHDFALANLKAFVTAQEETTGWESTLRCFANVEVGVMHAGTPHADYYIHSISRLTSRPLLFADWFTETGALVPPLGAALRSWCIRRRSAMITP